MTGYPSVIRRYRAVEQAVQVLRLLGYKQCTDKNGDLLPREWESDTSRPPNVEVEVRGPYPHRVVMRASNNRKGQ